LEIDHQIGCFIWVSLSGSVLDQTYPSPVKSVEIFIFQTIQVRSKTSGLSQMHFYQWNKQ